MSALSRPFNVGVDLSWWEKINKIWWLQRIPMALLTVPAAYGVAKFASGKMDHPFDWVAGIAFEAAYIGAVALADQQKDARDRWTVILWIIVNLIAVVCSALMNTLFFAGGKYADVNAEAITHGVPFAVLNFGYALLLHAIVSSQQKAEGRQTLREESWRDNQLMMNIEKEKKQIAHDEELAEIQAETLRLENEKTRADIEEKQSRAEERRLRRQAAPSAKSTIVATTSRTTELRPWTCRKCGSQQMTEGSPRHRESISARHGCEKCKVKIDADVNPS